MITYLTLRNFKCFEDQTFPLEPLTVLSGLNGMGKSSLIQALLLLRQSFSQDTLQQQGLALNGELVYIGNAQDALYQDADVEEISFQIGTRDGLSASWVWEYRKDADLLPLKTMDVNPTQAISNLALFTDRFHYLSAERLGPRTSFGTSNHQVYQHRQIGVRGEFAAHYLALFGKEPIRQELLTKSDYSTVDLKSQVDVWMSQVFVKVAGPV